MTPTFCSVGSDSPSSSLGSFAIVALAWRRWGGSAPKCAPLKLASRISAAFGRAFLIGRCLASSRASQSLVVIRCRVDFFQTDAVEVALHNTSFFGETEN